MLGEASRSMWKLMDEIEEMAKQRISAEKIAEILKGEVVRGGVYDVGIKVGKTTYCLLALQPESPQ